MDANYLTNLSFSDSLKNFKILLKCNLITYILERDGSNELASNATNNKTQEYWNWKNDFTIVQCYMLASMCNEL